MFYMVGRIWRRVSFWAGRDRLSKELAEELEHHLHLKETAAREKGSAGAAFDESRRAMGNLTLAKEESRDMWGFVSIDNLLRDIRYAASNFPAEPWIRRRRDILACSGYRGKYGNLQHHQHATDQTLALPRTEPSDADYRALPKSDPGEFSTALEDNGHCIRQSRFGVQPDGSRSGLYGSEEARRPLTSFPFWERRSKEDGRSRAAKTAREATA